MIIIKERFVTVHNWQDYIFYINIFYSSKEWKKYKVYFRYSGPHRIILLDNGSVELLFSDNNPIIYMCIDGNTTTIRYSANDSYTSVNDLIKKYTRC